VIANERQYKITKAALRRFEKAIDAHEGDGSSPDVAPRIQQATLEALVSEADELRAQIKRYEALRDGEIKQRELTSLRELPIALIEARIAAGLTQKALAERLGVPQQQVQRWEASRYSGVGVERLQEIADALGVEVREILTYASAA